MQMRSAGLLFSMTVCQIIIPSQSVNRPKSDLLKPTVVVILFALFPPLKDSELHHPIAVAGCMVALAFTSPNRSSLFASIRSSRASLLVDSLVISVRKLLSMHSRNFLDYLCPAVLCLDCCAQQTLEWFRSSRRTRACKHETLPG